MLPRSPHDQEIAALLRGHRLGIAGQLGHYPPRLILWLILTLQQQRRTWRWN